LKDREQAKQVKKQIKKSMLPFCSVFDTFLFSLSNKEGSMSVVRMSKDFAALALVFAAGYLWLVAA